MKIFKIAITFLTCTGFVVCSPDLGRLEPDEDDYYSTESEEARSVITPDLWPQSGVQTFKIPILFSPDDGKSTQTSIQDFLKDQVDQAYSALSTPITENARNISTDVQNFFRDQTDKVTTAVKDLLPENVRTHVDTVSIALESIQRNFGDLGFPEGQNTTLMEGMANIANEVQKTAKELHDLGVPQRIAENLLSSFQSAGSDEGNSETHEKAHREDDESTPTGIQASELSEDGQLTMFGSFKKALIIASVCIGVLIAVSVVGCIVYKRKGKNTKKGAVQQDEAEQLEKLNYAKDLKEVP